MGQLARMVLGMRKPPKSQAERVTKSRAYEIRTINEMTYFQELLKNLEAVATEPVNVSDHRQMIEQVGKQNAYRALVAVLRKDLETAERIIEGDQQRQRQR